MTLSSQHSCFARAKRTLFSAKSARTLGHFIMSVCRLSVCLSVVCRLSSVTFVRPTQGIEIFGNVSTPFGTWAIYELSVKILRRKSQRNPSVGGLNRRGVAKYSDFGPFQGVSRKRCKIEGKLLLITNRNSRMSFWMVPKSVTLNDLERRNSPK